MFFVNPYCMSLTTYAAGTEQMLLHYTIVSDFRTVRNYTTFGCRMVRRPSATEGGRCV